MYKVNELEVGYSTVGRGEPGREIGMSNVSLPTRMPFIDICEELSLEKDMIGHGNTKRYIWHNDDVLIVTKNDPIEEDGTVGNLGIEGDQRIVYRIFRVFTANAEYKDVAYQERKFV